MLLKFRLVLAVMALASASTASAQTWNGTVDTLWSNAANWNPNAVPGVAGTATFNNAGNAMVAINLGAAAQPIGNILFDVGSVAYTFSGNAGDAFVFDAAGGITLNAGVAAAQIVNTPLQLLGAFTATHNGTGLLSLNGAISLAGGGTAGVFSVAGSGNTIIAGAIGATAITGLNKTGTGILSLSGANAFTGGITVAGGTLTFRNLLAQPASGLTTVDAASTLGLGVGGAGFYSEANVASLFANTLTNVNLDAASTVGIDTTAANFTYTLSQSGARGLTKLGINTLTLTGANTYTGLTTVAAGTLQLGDGITNGSVAGNILNNATLTFNVIGTSTYAGVISGTGGVIKNGAGSLTLTGQNLYTGITTVNASTLILSGGDNRILPTTAPGFTGTSIFDLGTTNQTLANITFATNAAANFTVTGTGTLTLNGASNLQFGPTAAVAAASLQVTNFSGLSNLVINKPANTVTVGIGGANAAALGQIATVTLAATNTITALTLGVGSSGGNNDGGISTLNLGTANALNATTFNFGASGRSDMNVQFAAGLTNPTVTIRGLTGGSSFANLLSLGSVATFTGAAQATFTAAANFSLGTIDANFTTGNIGNANAAAAATRVGVINATFTQGAGTVNFVTLNLGLLSGTLTTGATALTGNGTYTLNNAAGTLNVTTLNLATNTITATGASTRNVNGTFNLLSGTLRATTIQPGVQTGTTATSVTRAFNFTTGTIENTAGANLVIDTVPITLLTTATHTFNATGTNSITLNAASPITGTTFGITKTGPGSLVFNAINTYSGGTTLTDGTLFTNTGAVLAAAGGSLTITGGTLDLNGTTQTVGAFSGTAGLVSNSLASTTGILAFGAAAAGSYAGNIQDGLGSVGLTKAGTGTTTLTGVNNYTGPTTVNLGNLTFGNALTTTGALTVAAGASLGFTNGAGNQLTTLSGLSLAVGTGSSSLNFQLATPTTSDTLQTLAAAITGNNTNTIVFNFTALAGFGAGTYPLLAAGSGLTSGGVNYSLGTLPSGFGFDIIATDTTVNLSVFTIVPTMGNIYWTGAVNTRWNQASGGNAVNFASTANGLTGMIGTPNPTNTVNFSATNALAAITTIETNFTINDLVFNNAVPAILTASIAPGDILTSTLTINPSSAAVGITLQAGAPPAVSISAPIVIGTFSQTWTVADAPATLTVSGGLTGTGNVTTAGLGGVILNNAGTTFTGNLAIGGASLTLGGTAATTLPALISGTGSLTKADAGTLTLTSAVSTYTGATNINGGILIVPSIDNGGAASGLGASTSAATNLTFNGGNLQITATGASSTNRGITFNGPGGIALTTDNASLALTGSLTGAGTATFGLNTTLLSSTSSYSLTANNTAFTGGVTINNGALTITNANNLGSGPKTIRVQVNTTGFASLRLDGSGGDVSLPVDFSFITSISGIGSGVISVAGNNTIAGSIGLDAGNGSSIFLANAGASLTLSGPISIVALQTSRGIILGGAGNGFISGAITDNGAALTAVTKNVDTGTWTVSGITNTYTGVTTVLGGTLRSGADNAFGPASTLAFGDTTAATGTFDLATFDQTFAALNARSNSAANANSLLIGAGKTLTITGSTIANVVSIGIVQGAAAANTRLNVIGATGTLTVNDPTRNIVVAQLTTASGVLSPSTLDLSALGTFNATVANIYVGRPTAAAGTAAATSAAVNDTLLLANNNTLNASGNIVVGFVSFSSGVVMNAAIRLGTTNAINANQWVIGGARANGTVSFNTGLTNPTAVLRGAAGGTSTTTIILGDGGNATTTGSGGGGSTVITGTLDFSAGTVDALIGALTVGNGGVAASNVRGQGNGAFTFGGAASTVTIDSLIVAQTFSDATATTNPGTGSTGTFTMNGGTLQINGAVTIARDNDITGGGVQNVVGSFILNGGNATIGSTTTPVDVVLGTHTNSNSGLATATFTVSGGTANIFGNLRSGDLGAGTITATVNLTGGILDLNANGLGTAGFAISNLNLQTGTLRNVLEINGGANGLVKSSPGTLIFAGTNSYTGPTAVLNGTLQITGNNTAATGSVAVNIGGTLRGTGIIGGAVGVVSGTIRAGNSTVGTLTLLNGLTTTAGGVIAVDLFNGSTSATISTGGSTLGLLPDPTSNNYLNITGGITTIGPTTLIAIDATGVNFTGSGQDYSYRIGTAANDQSTLNLNDPAAFLVTGLTASNFSLTGNASGTLFLNFTVAVPEPALLLLTPLLLLRRRTSIAR